MRENLETPPHQCPSIPTVILLPHTYSTMLIIVRKICFSRLLLPHTQFVVFITARELKKNLFPSILGSVLPPRICYLSIFAHVFFPHLGIFTDLLIPDF
jgi:hypothetical protein